MNKRQKQLAATAYHEAGHAIMAWYLNRKIKSVSILKNEDSLGRTNYKGWKAKIDTNEVSEERARPYIEKAILVGLAGEVAEHIYTGRHNWRGSSGDYDAALRLAMLLIHDLEDELPAYIKWLRLRARNILQVASHWHALKTLAEALLERKEMSGAEARETIFKSFEAAHQREAARIQQLIQKMRADQRSP